MSKIERVVVISDGIRGHFHQSVGVANWLKRLAGIEVEPIINVPVLKGFRKMIHMKYLVNTFSSHINDKSYLQNWIRAAGVRVKQFPPNTLFISAGGQAAPYCFAYAKSTGNKCAVIMTPSVLGTSPFDYAIIPTHDKHDMKAQNIFTTLGAPNHIYQPDLKAISESFFKCSQSNWADKKVVGLVIGGNDSNYKITPEWIEDILSPLRYVDGIKIFITTSRRTGTAADNAVEKIFGGHESVAHMHLMSRNMHLNLLTAILGEATHVFVTEDSISMVSEVITAGFKAGLIRLPRTTGIVKKLFGGGTRKFDETFDEMIRRGLVQDLGEIPNFDEFLALPEQRHNIDFNEAKRAAEWILSQQ